jgi:tRNA threonylcarbamoyl adenosine modification protein YeaZ
LQGGKPYISKKRDTTRSILIFFHESIGILLGWINLPLMNAVLAIETSVPQASVALWCDGVMVFHDEFTTDRNHNSMLFDPLEQALKLLDGTRLSLVIAGTGPGSYSGTRVGIAAGQGVAIAHNCPAVGLGSLGATPVTQTPGTPAMAVGDARRGLYFISPIAPSGEAMDAELMDAETFQKRLTEAGDIRIFTLDDPAKLGLNEALTHRITQTRPEAPWLMALWNRLNDAKRNELIAKPLAPAYLRPPFTSKAKGGHPLLRQSQ